MPPRLLCDCAYGAGAGVGLRLRRHDRPLRRRSGRSTRGTVKSISNQYAAMPSLHVAWSLWCALVLMPRLRHRWAKALVGLYPVVTVFAVVVTANHYLLDAVGGAPCPGVGYVLARLVDRVTPPVRRRGADPDPLDRPA